MDQITGYDDIAVFIGLDVGKGEHHAVALDRDGNRLFDKPLPNSETKLRGLFSSLQDKGPVLLVVDQPATIGALPVAVAQAAGATVGYLPGLAMRRIADLHPGEAKTDKRDALIIAETARTMPHTLRAIPVTGEEVAELTMLCGFDDDLAGEITRITNRIRGLLTQIHPALERVIGPHLDHPAMIDLLSYYGSPAKLRKAGQHRVAARMKKLAPRAGTGWAERIFTALDEQSVVVAGTDAAALVLPRLAAQLDLLRTQRRQIANQVEAIVTVHPLYLLLASMPAVGVRTAARIITETVGREFTNAAHLAAYAGLAPVTKRSGSSIRGEHKARGGNKKLKNALFLSAFAALRDPRSRAYYDRKRFEGKTHRQALLALARRRCNVIYAMLRDGTLYQPNPSTNH